MFLTYIFRAGIILWGVGAGPLLGISNLTKNDPFPLFTTLDPAEFLTTRTRNMLYGCQDLPKERVKLSISPFRQTANDGYGYCPGVTVIASGTPAQTGPITIPGFVELGNLNGYMNMLALLYDPAAREKALIAINTTPLRSPVVPHPLPSLQFVPNSVDISLTGQESALPPFISELPTQALQPITYTDGASATQTYRVNPELTQKLEQQGFNQLINPINYDPASQFGSYSIGGCYRKYGVRFEGLLQIVKDIGASIQLSVADISFDRKFTDRTCSTTLNSLNVCPTTTGTTTPAPIDGANYSQEEETFIQTYFMTDRQRDRLADAFGLNLDNYHVTGIDDLRLGLYARHLFPIYGSEQKQENSTRLDCLNDQPCFANFIFMPWVHAQAQLAVEPVINPNKVFALPLGNNGHSSVGFDSGFDLDFFDTIKIGFNAGFTHFFPRQRCGYRVPTDIYQNGFIPFQADVEYSPGNNWNFGCKMTAYHFLCNLSFYGQFIKVNHAQDRICILRSASKEKNVEDFLPGQLEKVSSWQSSLFNLGLTYDISSNFALGLLWQPTVSGRNVFRSGTLLGSLICTY